ncbi:hypothetical protein [Nocardia barduliensis]|uniref:hypothetical protein n=1 Tax=Nocardia barduliensis TaxID=2736643 RepID=UPI0015725582|nr:hypothetical protein [Nocardia barduliensis]
MLVATLILTTIAMVRRGFARRSASGGSAGPRAHSPTRRMLPVATALVTLLGVALAAGALTQC